MDSFHCCFFFMVAHSLHVIGTIMEKFPFFPEFLGFFSLNFHINQSDASLLLSVFRGPLLKQDAQAAVPLSQHTRPLPFSPP